MQQDPREALVEQIAALEARVAELEASLANTEAALDAEQAARQRAEELHDEQRRRLLIYEQVPVGVYYSSYRRSGSSGVISHHVEQIVGVTPEAWVADPGLWERLLHPDDREAVLAGVEEAWATGRRLRQEYRIRHSDGRWIWLHEEAALVAGDGGAPRRFQGFFYDITDRKSAEASVRSQEASYRSLLENIPDVIIRMDREGRTLSITPNIERLTGISVAAHLGRTAMELGMPASAFAEVRVGLERVFSTGEPQVITYATETPAGPSTYEARIVPERGDGGAIASVLLIARDVSERRQAEAALVESEQRLRMAVEAAQMATFEIDLASRMVTGLQLARLLTLDERLAVFPLDALIGRVHPDDQAAAVASMAGMDPAHALAMLESRIVRSDGSVRRVRTIGRLLPGQGTEGRIVGVVMDVTEQIEAQEAIRQLNADLEQRVRERTQDLEITNRMLRYEIADRERAEAALQDSRRFLERVIAASPSLVSILDYDSMHVIYANASLPALLGYPGEEFEGLGSDMLPQLMHPADLSGIPAQIERQSHMADDEVIEREFRLRHADGSYRWFSAYDVVFSRDAQGKPSQILGQMFDITARKRTETDLADAFIQLDALNAELRRSDSLLRAIVDNLDDGLVLIDEGGRVLMVNDALKALCDLDRAAILGRHWSEVCPFESSLIAQALNRSLAFSGRERIVRDGRTQVFDIRAIPLAQPGGDAQMVLHMVDVTERLQFEAVALKNERQAATGRLAAIVAHEVNSPLQAIQNFLFLAASDDPAERDSSLSMIAAEIDRIGGLIRRLLDLQRPGDDVLRALDANLLIDKVLTLTSSTMARHRVTVVRDLGEGQAVLEGRSDQLTQVLLNLILNALDTMPHGGELLIRSRRRAAEHNILLGQPVPPEVVIIEVADTGHGIPPELLLRIFDPFFTTKSSGSGLGLAISRQIVEQHGGQLSAHNRAQGGAVFTVVLPALRAGALEPARAGRHA